MLRCIYCATMAIGKNRHPSSFSHSHVSVMIILFLLLSWAEVRGVPSVHFVPARFMTGKDGHQLKSCAWPIIQPQQAPGRP